MRQTILTLFMMIVVGVFAFAEGRDRGLTQAMKPLVVDVTETGRPHLVLTSRGTRQQREARQQWQDCQIPNDSQQKTDEQNSSLMKGLVF